MTKVTKPNVIKSAVNVLTNANAFNVKGETILISPKTLEQTTTVVRGDLVQANKWKKLADMYMADGITSAMLELENNPTCEQLHEKIKSAIRLSFDKDVQDLFVKETKTLSDMEKGVKSFWTKQVGSKYNKIQVHVKNAEAIESGESEDNSKGANTKVSKKPKTPKAQVAWFIDQAIRTMQAMKDPAIGVSTDVKALQVIASKYQ